MRPIFHWSSFTVIVRRGARVKEKSTEEREINCWIISVSQNSIVSYGNFAFMFSNSNANADGNINCSLKCNPPRMIIILWSQIVKGMTDFTKVIHKNKFKLLISLFGFLGKLVLLQWSLPLTLNVYSFPVFYFLFWKIFTLYTGEEGRKAIPDFWVFVGLSFVPGHN